MKQANHKYVQRHIKHNLGKDWTKLKKDLRSFLSNLFSLTKAKWNSFVRSLKFWKSKPEELNDRFKRIINYNSASEMPDDILMYARDYLRNSGHDDRVDISLRVDKDTGLIKTEVRKTNDEERKEELGEQLKQNMKTGSPKDLDEKPSVESILKDIEHDHQDYVSKNSKNLSALEVIRSVATVDELKEGLSLEEFNKRIEKINQSDNGEEKSEE